MSRSLVVCPADDDLEVIEYFDSPLGPLIHECSRFHPPIALTCRRACVRCTRPELAAARGAAFDTGALDLTIALRAAHGLDETRSRLGRVVEDLNNNACTLDDDGP